MNTTHTKELTELSEKPKAGQLLETISLRDYFAAKAMQGMFASGNLPQSVQDDELAFGAYKMADEMLRAREEA